MKKTPSERKRPYLLKDARRRVLLEGASALVESRGWGLLTMSALADHVGVSRQLVYQHFPNLENLVVSCVWHMFGGLEKALQQALDVASSVDAAKSFQAACVVFWDLPKGQGDALWQLLSGTTLNLPELEVTRISMRNMILGLWMPVFLKHSAVSQEKARAQSWMLIMAFWGMRQLVSDLLLTRQEGFAQLDCVYNQVLLAKS